MSTQTVTSPPAPIRAPVMQRMARMQSTVQPGCDGAVFPSPSSSSLPGDLRGIFPSKTPIKIQFPCFGRKDDDPDPLKYVERCNDYLALNPLTDEEIIATLHNVLNGTARDWWDVARESVTRWSEFEKRFLSAFLSEDYNDELAERVRTKTQGASESIRDFAYSYRALCRRWKPGITEPEIIKLILKNIIPRLASQLRGRVNNVEELVRLGTQFERDWAHHQQTSLDSAAPCSPAGRPVTTIRATQTAEKAVMCWRCKGQHAPGSCPSYSGPAPLKDRRAASGPAPTNMGGGTNAAIMEDVGSSSCLIPLLRQLLVPVVIRHWIGKAILDTGSTYTLVHEELWKRMVCPQEKLKPWAEGPLYLANGEATKPLGWVDLNIHFHEVEVSLPVAVLPASCLAFAVVLGLDFMHFSGLKLNIRDQSYFLPTNVSQLHPFQTGTADIGSWTLQTLSRVQDVEARKDMRAACSNALLTAVPPIPLVDPLQPTASFYIQKAVEEAKLDPDLKASFRVMLENNGQVCTLTPGRTTVLQHVIYSHHSVPIKQRPYRLSPNKQRIVMEQLSDMVNKGIVEPSNSGWSSPVVLIPKKDGSHRFCVDYRRLNAVTENDAYPLPTIQEILDSLSGATIFSNLDLNSGYWQVAMDPRSKPLTAFVTPAGLFQFNVMPFGLKNAPASFQRLMETVLGELRGRICLVYLDDIIIYSSSAQQHLTDLQLVFDKLTLAGLTLNLKKCCFCLSRIKFLGHIVTPQGIQADPEKVAAVLNFPTPSSLKEVQRFLGMAGWYHRFVPGFSKVAEPLNTLKKKGVKFRWTEECQGAFDTLKRFLTSSPVLGHPNFDLHFIVYTDASETGIGAVLTQQTGPGCEEVLAYASRTLNNAERNYTTTERESLAVVWALEKWQYYLEPKLFTVVTDHVALTWILTASKTVA